MKKITVFGRVFILSMLTHAIILFLAYFILYQFMPTYYTAHIKNQMNTKVESLFSTINNAGNDEYYLNEFAKINNVDLIIQDDQSGYIFFQIDRSNLYISYGAPENGSSISDNQITVDRNDNSLGHIQLKYKYLEHKSLTMTVTISLDSITDAKQVIKQVYPIAIILCVLSSFIFAFLLGKIATAPIKSMRRAATKMTDLDDVQIEIHTNDEYGKLGEDINFLYITLKDMIDRLEQKIQIIASVENSRIEFLQATSHSIKTPLTAATALIEGILYKIPPYCDSPDKYLYKIKEILSDASQLAKESLDLSRKDELEQPQECNITAILQNTIAEYEVFITSKKIGYTFEVPNNLYLVVHREMITKILSNIISNAVKYTPKNGNITISFYNGVLSIENTCIPISKDTLEQVFKPFYGTKNDETMSSNGLGLYIVHCLLTLSNLEYSFLPTSDGMSFSISFTNLIR